MTVAVVVVVEVVVGVGLKKGYFITHLTAQVSIESICNELNPTVG